MTLALVPFLSVEVVHPRSVVLVHPRVEQPSSRKGQDCVRAGYFTAPVLALHAFSAPL